MKIESKYGRVIIDGRCTVRDALLAMAARHMRTVDVHQRVAVVSPRDRSASIAKAEAALRLAKLYTEAAGRTKGGSVAVRETLTTHNRPTIG